MDDAAEARAAAERLIAAFGSGRVDDYFACFTNDASFILHTTPQRLDSLDDYRRLWDRRMREGGFEVTSCISSDGRVQLLGDTAVFMHDVFTEVVTRSGGETKQERETIVFTRQSDGRWLAAHIHLSPGPRPTN